MTKIIPLPRRYAYKDDAQMVADVIAGDNLATRFVFYEQFNGILHGCYYKVVTARNLPVQYEDLVQELFLHISKDDWGKLREYDQSKGEFYKWFTTVVFRFFKDYCKKTYYRVSEFTDNNRIYDTQVDYFDWDNSELMRDLKRVLPEFEPPRDREIIEALIIRDEDKKDVAKRYGLHVDSVSRIFREGIARLVSNYLSDYKK